MTPAGSAPTPGYYVLLATDRDGSEALRARLRPAHRAYLRAAREDAVEVVQGGPTLDGDDGAMNGTLLVLRASGLEQALRFVQGDPYVQHGLFDTFVLRPWQWSLGQPGGGEGA